MRLQLRPSRKWPVSLALLSASEANHLLHAHLRGLPALRGVCSGRELVQWLLCGRPLKERAGQLLLIHLSAAEKVCLALD